MFRHQDLCVHGENVTIKNNINHKLEKIMGSIPVRVKPKTINLVFVASSVSMQH